MAELSFIRITVPQPLHLLNNTTLNSKTTTKFTACLKLTPQKKLYARDTPIDFGKHRGKMLGTLPSTYLQWVSSNLRAREFEHWAKLADEVLSDPVYRDRIEWEFAEKVLSGTGSFRGEGSVSELLEISERFGWDNEDKIGWKGVDFGLLGTSKGGRIPRVCGEKKVESVEKRVDSGGEELGKRRERRERVKKRREGTGFETGGVSGSGKEERGVGEETSRRSQVLSPFPGREGLLKKVLNRERVI